MSMKSKRSFAMRTAFQLHPSFHTSNRPVISAVSWKM
jgi:hypothetical protein